MLNRPIMYCKSLHTIISFIYKSQSKRKKMESYKVSLGRVIGKVVVVGRVAVLGLGQTQCSLTPMLCKLYLLSPLLQGFKNHRI